MSLLLTHGVANFKKKKMKHNNVQPCTIIFSCRRFILGCGKQKIFVKEKCDYTWKVFGVSSHVVGRN
jgi:hypothetical protein